MTFLISTPLLTLLDAVGADPRKVNAVIDRRLTRGDDARMRPGDHYPSLLRRMTGVPVVGISRASHHLLLEIESRTPLWQYRERTRNDCSLRIPANIPDTLRVALIGRPARALVLTTAAVDDLSIAGVEEDGAWTTVLLRPDWIRY